MILQCRDVECGCAVWRDYLLDGVVVKSPVDIDALPAYLLVSISWCSRHRAAHSLDH